jgi:hypothetical protein
VINKLGRLSEILPEEADRKAGRKEQEQETAFGPGKRPTHRGARQRDGPARLAAHGDSLCAVSIRRTRFCNFSFILRPYFVINLFHFLGRRLDFLP